jgi:TfoX/Sxy family transcriptional regulator of competence genes
MPDMPKLPRSSPEVVDRFAAVMDRFPDVERRKMFGYPAAFVGGNMATGLFGDRWVVRLAEAERAVAMDAGATTFEPMPGRPMTGFVVLPPAVVADGDAIAAWIEKGIAHAGGMPPKERGARKRMG